MNFTQYIFNQGDVIHPTPVDDATIEKYQDILPPQCIELWRTYGFSGISNGLIWLVDPDSYEPIREDWEQANDLLTVEGNKYYLIGRTAFGDLIFYVSKSGDGYFSMVDVSYNDYQVLSSQNLSFFFNILLDDESFVEMKFLELLFKACHTKLGTLAPDECYGFAPIPVLGGDKHIDYASKVKMQEYLSICAQSQM